MALADSPIRPGEVTVAAPAAFDAGLWFIGRVATPWTDPGDCPKRGDPEGGPLCRVAVFAPWDEGLDGLAGKPVVQLLYWMHRARRDLVRQSPKWDGETVGVFALRSPVRPNPVASSLVRLVGVEGATLIVRGLDCVDGTPLIDVKPDHGAFA